MSYTVAPEKAFRDGCGRKPAPGSSLKLALSVAPTAFFVVKKEKLSSMPAILVAMKETLSKVRAVVTLRPADVESPGGRSRERYRRAALTGVTATATKAITIATSLITVRLTLPYLGVERYGMWLTITSIVIMLGSADLGLGSGLINLVADATGRDDQQEARRAASSAFWMLTCIALLLTVAMAIAYPFVPWNRIFNVHSAAAIRESGPALMVFFACFAVGLPLTIVYSIQTGLQNGFINNIWTMLGSLTSLGALLLVIHFHAGLPVLILSLSGGPVIAMLLNGVQLFGWNRPALMPSLRYVSPATARRLLHLGMMFFLLQMSLSIAYQADNIVIAQIKGAGAVSAYAIPARLFNLVASLLVMLSSAMWPAYADAKARSDGQWIKRSFLRTAAFGMVLSAIITVFLIVFGNRIIAIWVGPQIHASAMLLTVFGIRSVLNAYLQPINLLMNGLNELKIQVIVMLTMAGVNIALSILFVRMFGIIGAVLGTVVAEAVVMVVPMTLALNRMFRQLGAT